MKRRGGRETAGQGMVYRALARRMQERQKTTGIEINVGKGGISIEKK